ncbi:transglutaminase-like domain-containing protein [Cellulomonas cellasea]|uniref:Transglutaminase n=2 Tax=Cellulomonas cellasea TaxID=43670 RepID=A0A0A0B4G0_9CELL|nr:transglutaminase family protein [Cellulomonas cellasea]KGM01022.1 transglutaminase [Cellulomonas cellasea DSM 20118]GEA89239.1 putative transglutaminase-like protein [Cellulomonas cellasea]
MLRTVTSHLSLDVRGPAELYLAVAVADGAYDRTEHLTVTHDDGPLDALEIKSHQGARLHRVHAPVGRVAIDYRATVAGHAEPPTVVDADLVEYVRPSRYAESDRLLAFSRDQFRGLAGVDLLDAVVTWVRGNLSYVSGSSSPTDGATDTLLKRRGVCRDFAHVTAALLRAKDVPARLASVYAPGLRPMDFHAVVEAYVDGAWLLVDATGLAPRSTMLRIATGRDATDTAFLSNYHGAVNLRALTVTATSQGDLPTDDGHTLTVLR